MPLSSQGRNFGWKKNALPYFSKTKILGPHYLGALTLKGPCFAVVTKNIPHTWIVRRQIFFKELRRFARNSKEMATNYMPPKFCIKLKTMRTNNLFALNLITAQLIEYVLWWAQPMMSLSGIEIKFC